MSENKNLPVFLASPDISIVVPVFRNAATLEKLHHRICTVMASFAFDYEILFIDDACPEDSWATIRQLAHRNSRTAGILLAKNVGQQRAVQLGLSFSRGSRMVILDGDLQDPPEAIPLLLGRLFTERQVVFASRRGRYESGRRLLSSKLFKLLLHWAAGVPEDAGIFCALGRSVAEYVANERVPRPYIVAMIGWFGPEIISIPVERSPRPSGNSAYSSWKRLTTGISAVFDSVFRKVLLPFWRRWLIPSPSIREKTGARFVCDDSFESGSRF